MEHVALFFAAVFAVGFVLDWLMSSRASLIAWIGGVEDRQKEGRPGPR